MEELMTTREVAAYLRLKERKIYDLVAAKTIPCTRVTGKWLFPRSLIDLWIMDNTDCAPLLKRRTERPPVITGTYDPLLEWATRESNCGLALLQTGSSDGLERLLEGRSLTCGLSLFQAERSYDESQHAQKLLAIPCIAVEWCRRQQGLMLPRGNPSTVRSIQDLVERRLPLAISQSEHAAALDVLADNGMPPETLRLHHGMLQNDHEVAAEISAGHIDVGFGLGTVARQHQLDFIPLGWERYDLIVERRDYFDPPFQKLLAFTRGEIFARHVHQISGYDISFLGRLTYNAPN